MATKIENPEIRQKEIIENFNKSKIPKEAILKILNILIGLEDEKSIRLGFRLFTILNFHLKDYSTAYEYALRVRNRFEEAEQFVRKVEKILENYEV
ncbi:unnamed protein product [Caenorhabditis nigoni]